MTDRQRFADFARIGADWLWETDSQDRFTYFSVATSRTGVELKGQLGLRRRDGAAQDPDNLARIATLDEVVARRAPFRDFLFRSDFGGATPHWCSISGEPHYDDHNRFLGYRGVGRDVTASVNTQNALEIQSRALEAILRAMPDGVQVIDKAYATLAVNDQVYEILGVPNRRDQPTADSTLQTMVDLAKRGEYGPGDPEKLARERKDVMLERLAAEQYVTYQRQLKSGRWMEARIRALDDGAFLSLYRDITEAKQHEAELERQATLLSIIVANIDGGIAVLDENDCLSAWNERVADLIGVEASLVRHGTTLREILLSQARAGEFGPCDPETEADRLVAIYHGERIAVSERMRPNGRIVEVRRSHIPGGGSVTIYIDITARKQAEQTLQDLNATLERRIDERTAQLSESERFQRSLVSSVPGMVYRCRTDLDWTIEFASEGSRALLGVAPEELVGDAVVYSNLIHPDDRQRIRWKWREDFAADRVFELEYRVRHVDGSWRWVVDRARGIRSDAGDLILLEGLVLDVTARKLAEQELGRARDNLRDAIDSLDHDFVLYDREDRLVLFTDKLHDRYPLAGDHFTVGSTFSEILHDVVDSGALAVPPGLSKEQFIAERTARHQVADGSGFVRHMPNGRAMQISEHRAQSGGTVSIGRDITDQLKIEERLREAQRMDAIGRLTGGLAHGLNNYLAVIIGNLDMLAERTHVDPEVPNLIAGAVGGALRGAELTRSLLAFSRRQPLDPEVTDVGRRVSEVVKLVKRTIGENIVVEVSTPAGVWPVKIDGAQLDTCIVNLANNAREAMPKGGTFSISVRNVTAEDKNAPTGEYVVLELADTGIGMNAETLARVYEPFFTTKGPTHGTGLGLSMVHGFVHQSGGVIDIVSNLGEGTTVRLFLPRTVEAGAVAEARPKASVLPRGSERILLVEDNEHVRSVAVEQLTSLGYSVVEAENGDAALAMLESTAREFDLIFSDMMMPGEIDGFELAQLVLGRWPDKKVLLTSGFSGDVAEELEKQATGISILRKPYRKADLARALRVILAA